MGKKNIILIALLFVSSLSFGQTGSFVLASRVDPPASTLLYSIASPASVDEKIVWSKEELRAQIKAIKAEEEEYDTASYFAVYLAIQTSSVTKAQTKLVKEMTVLVKKNGGVMYTVIQSGVPPLCGLPGYPKCQ